MHTFSEQKEFSTLIDFSVALSGKIVGDSSVDSIIVDRHGSDQQRRGTSNVGVEL
jgi:hypothetical protein